ncbi:MAG: pseudouridine synthase [Myxococcota bacterium]
MRFLLPRWLSRARVASRRAAEQLVADGEVRVNGAVCRDVLRLVDPDRDVILVRGVPVRAVPATTWLALNKPAGVVCTTRDPEGRRTVLDLVAEEGATVPGLAPVGRLDRASAGLVLLTDDHALAARLLDPASHVAKVYRVKVRGHPDDAALGALRHDTLVDDGWVLGPMEVTVDAVRPRSTWLGIVLREGKNRQIRRRLDAVGHPVELLIRTAVGPVTLSVPGGGELPVGAIRPLTDAERAALDPGPGAGPLAGRDIEAG